MRRLLGDMAAERGMSLSAVIEYMIIEESKRPYFYTLTKVERKMPARTTPPLQTAEKESKKA